MARPRKIEGLTVEWEEKGGYPVSIVEDVFAEDNTALIELLRTLTGRDNPRVMLVADSNVVQRISGIGTRIGKYVQTHGITLAGAPAVVGGGEKAKGDNMASVYRVIDAAVEAKVGAGDVMLALGGGAVLDVAGFAAAQVRGGVKLVRLPTTVAAMLDGAFAADAAVNRGPVKDALRLRSRPAAVVVDPTFARTVLDGVWRGGLGEAVRFAAVADATLMRRLAKNAEALKNRDWDVFVETLRDTISSRVKRGSTGFALWSANRLESMSGYKLPHGYAVPIAICIDCAYAVAKGWMKEEDQETVCRALYDCGSLDGLLHSRHLLTQPDGVLCGLDAWRLATGAEAITVPGGFGVAREEPSPDRETFRKVMKEFLEVSDAN